ncbi:MAG TPA: hypothetical protein VFF74_00775 [Methylophilaceae bacterium]|nr:hypothetical protein [Methylophilaceae bacterium]
MSQTREEEALAAYLKLLQNKGASHESLEQREKFLLKLIALIAEKPHDGLMYREAVEDLLEQTDKADWPFGLAMAREYYPFWTKDIKAIAALNADAVFDVESPQWQPLDCNLKALWNMLDKEQFSIAETWPLKAYTLALRQEGAAQSLVDTRVKLVKLLLVRLRDAPEKNHRVYRIAVDTTMPLFGMRDTRRLFLVVVREFYYFWIGDPAAATYILTEATSNSPL